MGGTVSSLPKQRSLSESSMDQAFMDEFERRIREPAPIPKSEAFQKLEQAAHERR